MKKNIKSTKLSLNKERVRELTNGDLAKANGGMPDPSRHETFCDSAGLTCTGGA